MTLLKRFGDAPYVALRGVYNLLCGLTHLDLHHQSTGAYIPDDAIPIWEPGFTRHELFTNNGYWAHPVPPPSPTEH